MDKNKNAVEQLKEGISVYVDKKLDNIPFDRTFTALITKVSSNNTYSVLLNGVEYNNIRTIGGECYVNETVKVVVPQNNYNNMYILKVFEDTSSYKLYEYSNDYEFNISGNSVIKQWDWKSQSNKDCYFRVTDEYFVTKQELYRQNNSTNLKVSGSYTIKRIVTDDNEEILDSSRCVFNSTTSELKYRTQTENPRIAGVIKRKDTQGIDVDFVKLTEANKTNYDELAIDGIQTYIDDESQIIDKIATTHLLYMSGTNNYSAYPNNDYNEYYFDNLEHNGINYHNISDYCNGYISANFPIFENEQDAFDYKNAENDFVALSILERAINYKEVNEDELFATTVLMNPNSKIKIDMEFLLDYSVDGEVEDEDNFILQYYVDGELDERQPKGRLNKGNNVVRVMYILSNDTGGKRAFSVGLKLKDGNVNVQERGVWVTISGIGLLDQTFWNGDVNIEEAYELVAPLNPIIVSFSEDVDATIIDRPIIRNVNWGYMLSYTWGQAGDNYIW